MLVSTTTRGRVGGKAWGRVASSTSNRPTSARGRPRRSAAWTSALTMPVRRLAPARLWTMRRPLAARTWASRRAVVVLPLVPETSTTPSGSAALRWRSAPGASRGTTWPAMTVPPPRPSRRLSALAARPASTAPARRQLAWGRRRLPRRAAGAPLDAARGLLPGTPRLRSARGAQRTAGVGEDVGVVEGERGEGVEGEEAGVVGVVGAGQGAAEAAQKVGHADGVAARVAGGIGVDAQQALDGGLEAGLLAHLADDGGLDRFAHVHEAAGQGVAAREGRVAPADEQHRAVLDHHAVYGEERRARRPVVHLDGSIRSMR